MAWCDQLAVGGRLGCAYIAAGGQQMLLVIDKSAHGLKQKRARTCSFCPQIGDCLKGNSMALCSYRAWSCGWVYRSAGGSSAGGSCGTRLNKAPVEDRGTSSNHASSPSVQPGTVVATPIALPGAENAGKPGYYTVKPRRHPDSVIGLETGRGWKDIARWNNLENPNLIEVGRVLRVTSTVPAPPSAAAAAVAADTGVVTRPVASSSVAPASAASAAEVHLGAGFCAASTASAASAPAAAPAASPAAAGDEDVAFIWPASGVAIGWV